QRGARVIATGARGGLGPFAVQLARWAGGEVVDGGEADLVFDTTGPAALTGIRAGRIVSVAKEAPGVTYFIVEPNRPPLRAPPPPPRPETTRGPGPAAPSPSPRRHPASPPSSSSRTATSSSSSHGSP